VTSKTPRKPVRNVHLPNFTYKRLIYAKASPMYEHENTFPIRPF